ncbi:MAG: hypothetical protein GTN40_03925 [Candidatus Aenigmarchaeota archaeon]|nr:hypothetical protein [Candidatus Aenigmarchaeota archaeon]
MKESFGYIKTMELGANRILVIMSNIKQPVAGSEQFIISYDILDMLPKIGRRKIGTDLDVHELNDIMYHRLRHLIKINGESL